MNASNTSPQSERFHALDATRAFALLLGVVFHAAWSFVPAPTGAAVVDASASRFFDWFLFTSHTFRMQLFFLIAGFFAHMVCHRRGVVAFTKNRLLRIGVPLVVGWLVIYPLGFFQARFPGHSPAWRYVADGSYWIYLVHLPLVAALQVWMAPWPWPGEIKFLLLNLVAFVILFASYHFLVRSTFIGRVLNGRSHPLVAWPFRRADWRSTAIASSIQPGK